MLACFRAVEGIVPLHVGHDHSSDTGAASVAPAASRNSSVLMSLPNDPLFGKQWYLHNVGQTGGPSGIDIKAVAAWQKVFSSKAITVAVVDTGVDVAHPDLKDQIWINAKEIPGNGIDDEGNGYIDDINGWNFFHGNNLPADLDGHGTHVGGTIGASNNNNIGITGIALGSPLMAVKVLPSEEERIDTPGEANAIAYGIRYAADNGAKIINLSLGSDNDDLELKEAVIYAASKGALLIAAAGNDNKSDEKSIGWPSNYNKIVPNNLINIGSTNELGLKSGFSNFGDSVDLLAPGGKGDPDERPNGSAADIYSTEKGSYQYSFGTSMATPVVSGSAALVWAINPAWNAETVIKILINSARVTPDLSAYAKQGRQLDLYAAVTYAQNLLGTQVNSGAAAFSISGKGDVGSQLLIIKTKDDPEGNGKFTYKWQSSVDGTNWTNLAATSSSYTIAATDASKQLRASISYLDGKSNSESVDTSALSVAAVASSKITAGDFATPVNINLSLPAYVISGNWNIDQFYYYVEQYPMTLRTAFYADYLAGRYTNQALYGQNHYLTGGQAEGRSMPGTDGILPDSNDYGAYVENYGITLLDIYRVDSRAVVNGGTMSLFAWGKEHYTNWGKAEGREITGGVEWGGIVRNNLDLYNQWQDAKIVNPTLSAFAFGYQRQNTIKSTLGVLVGSDTADKLTGQIAYGLNGNDVICSDGGRGILAGGFGDDLLVAANGGSDLAYGGPGSDIFQLNAGSSFNIRDFRKGADMIQLGSTLTSSGVTTQWDSADNSTYFYNGSSVIGKVYGKRPTEFTYSDSTNGVSKVYI